MANGEIAYDVVEEDEAEDGDNEGKGEDGDDNNDGDVVEDENTAAELRAARGLSCPVLRI